MAQDIIIIELDENDIEDFIADASKLGLDETAFVYLADEELGLCVDIVCSRSDQTGWGESVTCFLEEDPTDVDYAYADALARRLAEELEISIEDEDGNVIEND